MKNLRLLWIPVVLLVIVFAGWWWHTHTTEESSALVEGQDVNAVLKDPAVIAKGRYLATVGDCMSCHTEQGGAPYAGGRVIATPFGNIPVPNITPDPEHGIGRWSVDDFWRALHTGIGHDGEKLYPVFSYTSFTKTTREDAVAMFAYLQSVPPVAQAPKPLDLKFPYSMRSSLTAWRALYFKPGVYKPDPNDDLRAIATYLQSLPARPKPTVVPPSFDSASLVSRGRDVYAKQCADCHRDNGAGVPGVYPTLDGNSSVVEPTGINAARAVLLGGFAPLTQGNPRPYSMPPYAQQLSDADVAAVVTYIRQAWSNRASAVEERDVAAYRHTPVD
ncbi:cytochrome c [Dyella dinghuensis]|uniref:Cytochrome c n=1 Tax=Dyella dinghuensis TaxID=1920169 RepID=A0A3S0PHC4_9GAMM|nr:cytochrome c [Dyella dinghuensis]RUL65046.1 cytochrome c [Dyella dinghuensis]